MHVLQLPERVGSARRQRPRAPAGRPPRRNATASADSRSAPAAQSSQTYARSAATSTAPAVRLGRPQRGQTIERRIDPFEPQQPDTQNSAPGRQSSPSSRAPRRRPRRAGTAARWAGSQAPTRRAARRNRPRARGPTDPRFPRVFRPGDIIIGEHARLDPIQPHQFAVLPLDVGGPAARERLEGRRQTAGGTSMAFLATPRFLPRSTVRNTTIRSASP